MQVQENTSSVITAIRLPGSDETAASVARELERFTPISLAAMESVALLSRIDTKYVMSEAQFSQALSRLTADYAVLEIAGRKLHRYQTLYFDTPDFALYRQHHNSWSNRYKVRARAYVDSNLSFLEVKHKTNKNITVKSRSQTPALTMQMDARATAFLQTCYPDAPQNLEPVLWNNFQRITLVSKHRPERLTLDVGVHFWLGSMHAALPNVVIAEVKQEGFSLRSDFVGQMRALGVREMRFSKYCMGLSLLCAQVKHNNFKPQWLHINKIMREGDDRGRLCDLWL
ncbi:MAG TPA: polyphosphate polymerase domain-containing protein [Anaerolineae bacterium]|nr:polyphosphate polymerase domain-containing protein [Anaerolineae bacterium]HQI83200.1 polyphosphate polymerase domain-containing protein [Anaerolineae bacterium]